MDTGPINANQITALAATSTTPQPADRTEHREIIQAVRALNGAEIFGQHQELTFSLDRETQRPVLKIVDRKTGEVVTQLPPEHVLRLARHVAKP